MSDQESDRFYESAYRELRRRAKYFLSSERAGHTLQPTEIVHEVWLRLRSIDPSILSQRSQFLAIAGRVMRNLLVDYARARGCERRGGDYKRVEFPLQIFSHNDLSTIILIDEMLQQLTAVDPRAAKVVELRFFGGLTEAETAGALGVSERTVKRDWGFAKLWIRSNLGSSKANFEEQPPDGELPEQKVRHADSECL